MALRFCQLKGHTEVAAAQVEEVHGLGQCVLRVGHVGDGGQVVVGDGAPVPHFVEVPPGLPKRGRTVLDQQPERANDAVMLAGGRVT